MEKQVHVNSYTRKDGTKVKEHYRNITASSGFAPEQNEDGFKTILIPQESKNILDILRIPTQMSVNPRDVLNRRC